MDSSTAYQKGGEGENVESKVFFFLLLRYLPILSLYPRSLLSCHSLSSSYSTILGDASRGGSGAEGGARSRRRKQLRAQRTPALGRDAGRCAACVHASVDDQVHVSSIIYISLRARACVRACVRSTCGIYIETEFDISRYAGQNYMVVVNGQNGNVYGDRPYSVGKVASLSITGIGAIVGIFAKTKI